MIRALVLDDGILRAQRWFGVASLVLLVVVAFLGNALMGGTMVLLWIVMGSGAHRDLAALGRIGALQSVLGVSRADAVRARYLTALTRGLVAASVAVAVAVAGRVLGMPTAGIPAFLTMVLVAWGVASLQLTLGYVAPRPVQRVAGGISVACAFAVAVTASGRSMGVDEPVTLPLVLGLFLAGALMGAIGSRFAIRAHSRATL